MQCNRLGLTGNPAVNLSLLLQMEDYKHAESSHGKVGYSHESMDYRVTNMIFKYAPFMREQLLLVRDP